MFRTCATFVILCTLALTIPAHASVPSAGRTPPTRPPAPVNKTVVKTVEKYLESLTTLKAHFVQTAEDGQQRAGTFYLKRPGKMRIVYAAPDKDFIVADGLFIHYYDAELKRTSSTLISHSIANFFLRKHLKLSGDIRVAAAAQKGDLLTMTVEEAKNPLAGSLTLLLGTHPLQLKSWRVIDAEGLVTTVDLSDIQTGITLKGDLFHYYDPTRAAHLYNEN